MIKTIINLISLFFCYWNAFTFSVACARVYRDIPFVSWNKRKNFYEKRILEYLREFIQKNCKNTQYQTNDIENQDVNSETIWVMWWQGVEGMPPIVRACWNQLNKVSSSHKIILITKENWRNYIQLPNYIIEKVNKGKITLTHFSDIIRIYLLNYYGGLWIDATVWVEDLPYYCFNNRLFTLHGPGMFPDFISRGEWVPFFLGTNERNYKLFSNINIILLNYWEKHNVLIDYLLIDYLIFLIYNNNNDIFQDINSLKINKDFYILNSCINNTYVENDFEEMMKKSPLQKLSYKNKFIQIDKLGNLTNYGYILKITLDND